MSIRNKNILLAEDEEINVVYIQAIFEDEPVNLLVANNGKEAVDMCKTNPDIDLILMDIRMPEMDGLEATMLIREFRPTLPIIVQTAYQSDADRRKAFEAGCTGFIGKPLMKDDLIKLVNGSFE